MFVEKFSLVLALLITAIGVQDCNGFESYLEGCGDCAGPWIFPFTAEKVIHAVIPEDTVAEIFRRTVVENDSLSAVTRSVATYKFLADPRYALDPMLKELYDNATMVVNYEKASYLSIMCYAEPCLYYLPMMEIINEALLPDNKICKNLKFLFCDVSDAELKILRYLPAYRYRVERSAPPPTFYTMFHTYIFEKQTSNQQYNPRTLMDGNTSNYYKNTENAYLTWVSTLEGEKEQAMAMLQWHVYVARTQVKIKCSDSCGKQWFPKPLSFPFTAEKVLHNYLESDQLADLYEREVLNDQSLSLVKREKATYRFLKAHKQGRCVTNIYKYAKYLTDRERDMYYKIECNFFGSYCDALLSPLINIYTNTSLTELQVCHLAAIQICSMKQSKLDALVALVRPYTYRVERNVYIPTFSSARTNLYAFRQVFNENQMDIMEIMENSKDLNDMDHLYMRWMTRLHSEKAINLALFLWFIHKSRKLHETLPRGRLSKQKISAACLSCDGPWYLPFTAESMLYAILPNHMTADYSSNVLTNYNLSLKQSKIDTYRFLDRYQAIHFKKLYENITLIFDIEKEGYRKAMESHNEFRITTILRITNNELMPYAEKCAQIEREVSELTMPEIIYFFKDYKYNYYAVRNGHVPSFDDLLTTYTFKRMSNFDQRCARDFLDSFVYRPKAEYHVFYGGYNGYLDWAARLPLKEAEALALIHWSLHYQKCIDVFQTINTTKKAIKIVKSDAYPPCNRWMQSSFPALHLMTQFIEPFDILFKYQCILDNPELTKWDRELATEKLLADAGGNYLEILKNLSAIQAYEQSNFYKTLFIGTVNKEADEAMLTIEDFLYNKTLTDRQTCELIEEYAATLKFEPLSLLYYDRHHPYKVWIDNPFAHIQDMFNSFAFQKIPKETRKSLERELVKLIILDVSVAKLGESYFEWVCRLESYAVAQKLAIYQWHLYMLYLKRQHGKNLKLLQRRGVNANIVEKYKTFVNRFNMTDPEDESITISQVQAAVEKFKIKDLVFKANLTMT